MTVSINANQPLVDNNLATWNSHPENLKHLHKSPLKRLPTLSD